MLHGKALGVKVIEGFLGEDEGALGGLVLGVDAVHGPGEQHLGISSLGKDLGSDFLGNLGVDALPVAVIPAINK